MSSVALKEPEKKIYKGTKKTNMPDSISKKNVLPLRVLCQQYISKKQAEFDNIRFLKDIIIDHSTPDFGGYHTSKIRESGKNVNLRSTVLYSPLINDTPSDPSKILTAMFDVEKVSKEAGQDYTLFTCDQQLFRVTMDIIWNDPARWTNFYPRPQGYALVNEFRWSNW